MIKINVITLPTPSPTNLSELIPVNLANKIANDVAEKLRRDIGDKSCPDHPEHKNNTINVIASKSSFLRFDKINFCCKNFEDSIQLAIP